MYPTIVDMLKQTPATESDTIDAGGSDVSSDLQDDSSSTSFSFNTILPIIAIGGAIYYFATKKK